MKEKNIEHIFDICNLLKNKDEMKGFLNFLIEKSAELNSDSYQILYYNFVYKSYSIDNNLFILLFVKWLENRGLNKKSLDFINDLFLNSIYSDSVKNRHFLFSIFYHYDLMNTASKGLNFFTMIYNKNTDNYSKYRIISLKNNITDFLDLENVKKLDNLFNQNNHIEIIGKGKIDNFIEENNINKDSIFSYRNLNI